MLCTDTWDGERPQTSINNVCCKKFKQAVCEELPFGELPEPESSEGIDGMFARNQPGPYTTCTSQLIYLSQRLHAVQAASA